MTDLAALSAAKLAVAYNALAALLDLKTVNKFADRATALKRVADLVAKLEAADKVVTIAADGSATVADKPAPQPEPTPEPTPESSPQSVATAAKAPAAPKRPQGRPASVADDDVIELLHVGANPKKANAALRFAHYKTGLTVAGYVAAVGDRYQALRDLAWDQRQKWVRVVGAKAYARRLAAEATAASDATAKAA